MTASERISATLERRTVDRCPVDLWCTREVLDTLRAHTGEEDELAVYQALGLDKIVWVFPRYRGRVVDPNEGGTRNLWGVATRAVQAGAATYNEVADAPLHAAASPADVDAYSEWPDPDGFDYAEARAAAERARDFGFATIGPWISHFEVYCQMRGLENALMDVLVEPQILEAALVHIDRIQTEMLERYLSELDDTLDIVFISDDMGTQDRPLISLAVWKQFFEARLTRWCEIVHRHGKKVQFHSDGAIRDLIPSLIACGVDILNPIQHLCPGMDRAGLKRDFGEALIFHGAVDNQRALPFGSVDDVVRETRANIETLGAGGGYICCSCHNVQAGTPVENIVAMIETAHAAR